MLAQALAVGADAVFFGAQRQQPARCVDGDGSAPPAQCRAPRRDDQTQIAGLLGAAREHGQLTSSPAPPQTVAGLAIDPGAPDDSLFAQRQVAAFDWAASGGLSRTTCRIPLGSMRARVLLAATSACPSSSRVIAGPNPGNYAERSAGAQRQLVAALPNVAPDQQPLAQAQDGALLRRGRSAVSRKKVAESRKLASCCLLVLQAQK